MASEKTIMQDWMEAQKRHHLSHIQVQMACEPGFKPDSLRKTDNHKELWETPLPQHRAEKAAEESGGCSGFTSDDEDIIQLGLDSCGD